MHFSVGPENNGFRRDFRNLGRKKKPWVLPPQGICDPVSICRKLSSTANEWLLREPTILVEATLFQVLIGWSNLKFTFVLKLIVQSLFLILDGTFSYS
jgi:hypothetical protein